MSKRLVEREALFFLIDLSGGAGQNVVQNPLSKTAVSLGGVVHSDVR
jgi:hypothetical protein